MQKYDQAARNVALDALKQMNECSLFPMNTDPSSRHVAIMADCLGRSLHLQTVLT